MIDRHNGTSSAGRVRRNVRGDLEYIDVGEGPAILYCHGTGAGAELVPPFEQPLIDDGCRLIIPNRPGYHGTPLADRPKAADCADLCAALLEELQIERVVVMGTSGGGPTAAAFAARYPQQAAGLVMQCAQSHAWDEPRWLPDEHRWLFPLLRRRMLRPMLNIAHRSLGRFSPAALGSVLEFYSGERYPDLREDPLSHQLMRMLIEAGARCAREPAGIDNDLEILFDPQSTVQPGTITCPTLVIHDRTDPVVPFDHVEWLLAAVPQAEFTDRILGGHLIWLGRDSGAMHNARLAFVRRVLP